MSKTLLSELELLDVSVAASASFAEAAEILLSSGLSAIAVVDESRAVVGFFTEDDLLKGLFPGYLDELRHTAFLRDDVAALSEKGRGAAEEPVARHMRKAITVNVDDSAAHVAERFLHCEWGALAVVDERGKFLGMVRQTDFCRALLRRLQAAPSPAPHAQS
jgi:CBS-domain-containing membrane protein